jgi:hypothetical protein
VIAPQNLDERHQRVKTDGRGATALVGRRDRFVHGNRETLAVLHVPTTEEEQRHSQARLRQAFQWHRQRLEVQGRGCLLYYGLRVRGRWWRTRTWPKSTTRWPTHLVVLLSQLREVLLATEQQLRATSQAGSAAAPAALLRHEVCDR